MSATPQAPAAPPLRKGIVKQVSAEIHISIFVGYSGGLKL